MGDMTTTRPDLDSAAAVLEFARERRADADRAEADVLLAAVTWAEQHPPESIDHAATWPMPGADTELSLAGPGAPLVSEFSIAEFASAIGLSTDSGRALIAHSLELKYRLPQTYRRVQAAGQPGGLAPWRARRIAQATLGLTPKQPTTSTPRSRRLRTRPAPPSSTASSKQPSPDTCPTSPNTTPNKLPTDGT
jgi:hypothetical protein